MVPSHRHGEREHGKGEVSFFVVLVVERETVPGFAGVGLLPHRGRPQYGLTPAQVYPEGVQFDACLRDGIAPRLDGLVITKETPVASIGSCFSEEFARHMRDGDSGTSRPRPRSIPSRPRRIGGAST